MKKIYRSLTHVASVFLLLFMAFAALAQSRVVTGTITDELGSPMPGVNVVIKGTTVGTTTNSGGFYSIAATEGNVIVASFIGYTSQEIKVETQSTIDFQLAEDIATLQEIVVVGYGEMKRTDLTSSQTSVSSDQIQKTVNTTIEQAIQGRSAGVYITQNSGQPGGGISVNIRGVNSINGSNEPLYVIDGVQIQPGTVMFGSGSSSNPLATLNPADIESIEVLQGPSATAVYGSRATNGVLLITTKRGKSGETKISYGYQYSIQAAPKKLDVMNLREYAEMVNAYHAVDGGTVPTEFLDPSLLGNGTDWQEELFTNAPMSKHQLSLSGGSDKTTYYLSGEYLDQDGIALGSGFNRYSVRLNIDNKPRKWLSLGGNFSFSQTDEKLSTSQENIIQTALNQTPQIPVKNLDGSWGGADPTNGANQFTLANPIALASITTNDLTKRQFLGGLNIGVDIIKGLTFRTSFNANLGFNNSTYYVPKYEFSESSSNPEADLRNESNHNTYWNWNQLLEYNTKIGKHTIGAMISHEAQESTYKNLMGARDNFLVNIPDLNVGDATDDENSGGQGDWAMESYLGRVNYNFDDRYIVMGTLRADGSVNFGPDNKWGVFPSISAAWRISEEAFFHVPLINELKLRLETGLTGNQGGSGYIYSPLRTRPTQWGTGFSPERYGNPGLKWEETRTNNIGLNVALLENKVQFEFDYYIKDTDNLLLANPLPDYMGTQGEGSISSPQVNIGALQNKGWGLTISTVNMDSKGFKWETNFNISAFKTKIKEFYSETATISRTSWWLENWTQTSKVGEAPWLFTGYIQEGIFKSVEDIEDSALPVDNTGNEHQINEDNIWIGDAKFKDVSGPEGKPDGIIDAHDLTTIGNPWPKFFAGLTNTFSYKGFDLSILVTSTYGNDIYNFVAKVNTNPNAVNLSRNMLDDAYNFARVTTDENGKPVLENPGTDIPRVTNGPNGNYSRHTSYWVEDGSFIRIKNISLTYNLPASLLSKQNIVKGARVSVGAQNVATFTKYTGYDPEVGAYVGRDASNQNQAIGLDNGRYPLTPVYTFSVGIDF